MSEGTAMTATLNSIDMGVIFLTGLSAFIGVLRGFTKEILSIGGWAGAVALTFFGFPYAKPFVQQWVGHPFLSSIVTVGLLFLSSLIAFILIIRNISELVRGSRLSGLDRSLGLLFGILRALAILILLYFLSSFIWKTEDRRPLLIKSARSLPLITEMARRAASIIPAYYLSPGLLKSLHSKIEQTPQDLIFELAKPPLKDIDSASESISKYGNGQRLEMNRLFQNYGE